MNGQAKMQEPFECVQSVTVPIGTEKRRFIIYKVTNQINGKVYVGQTAGLLKRRKGDHVRKALAGSPYYFHNAIRKYGPDVFVWEVMCLCLSKDEADKKECEFIKGLNTKFPFGYNLTDGGEGTVGFSPTKETREKISKAQKMYIQRTGNVPFKGMKHSAESRAKITAAQMGKKRGPHSAEHNEKIRNALKGRTITEEQKAMISKALTGRRLPPERCAASGKAHRGLKRTDEIRENMKKIWIARKQKSPNGHGYLKNGVPDYRGRIQP
jgi:group I intron endonuclease